MGIYMKLQVHRVRICIISSLQLNQELSRQAAVERLQ